MKKFFKKYRLTHFPLKVSKPFWRGMAFALPIGIVVWFGIFSLAWGATYKVGVVTDVHYRVTTAEAALTRLSTIATKLATEGASAIFMLGDIIDNSSNRGDSQTQIANIAAGLSGKTAYWTPGSHDFQGTTQANWIADAGAFLNSPSSDGDFYVDFGAWRFICITSVIGNPTVASATTLTYFENQLEAARVANKYIVVLTHGDPSTRYPGATSLADSIWMSLPSVVRDDSAALSGAITPSSTTGTITITSDAADFVAGDVGRWLIGKGTGNSWGVCIVASRSDANTITCTVQAEHDFPDTNAIASGSWGYLSTPITHNKDAQSYAVYNSEAIFGKINTAVGNGAEVKVVIHGHRHIANLITNSGIGYYGIYAPTAGNPTASALLTLEDDGTLRITGMGPANPRNTLNANTVYIDQTNGDDTANGGGLSVDPWKTLAKVNAESTLPAGTTTYLKKGDTWREQLTIPNDGSSGLPITVTSYGTGSAPIIDGSDLVSTWTAANIGATVNASPAADNDDCRLYGSPIPTFELTNDIIGIGLSTSSRYGGTRFKTVSVPKNATITSANVQFYAQASGSGTTVNARIRGEANATPGVFVDRTDYEARSLTTATVDWNDIPAWTNDAHGAAQLTPDIKTIVQEIVNLAGWSSGNNLVLFFNDNGSSAAAFRNASSVTWNSGTEKAVLTINYGGMSSTIFQAACAWTPAQVFQDGTRLAYVTWDTDITTTAAAMSAGTWTLNDAGNLIYVWCTDGADPDTHSMSVSRRDYAVTTNGKDYVVLQGVQLQYANVSNSYLNGAHQSEMNYCLSRGGVSGATIAHASAKIQNSTIVGNTAGVDVNSAGTIINTILNGNTAGLDEIGATATVTYSALQAAHAGAGNITSNPLLTSDYKLGGGSPARNAGVPPWTYAAFPGDMLGNKIYGSAPDLGAYEKKQFIFDDDDAIPKKCKSTNAACYVQP